MKINVFLKSAFSIMLALVFLVSLGSVITADTITTFSDTNTETEIAFSAAGNDTTKGVNVPFDATATSATMVVSSSPFTLAGDDYPLDPSIDVGNDGDVQWAYSGTGYGQFGHQLEFSDDTALKSYSASWPTSDTSNMLLLPKAAQITSATIDIEGSAGYDAWSEQNITRNIIFEEMGMVIGGVGDINGDGFDDYGVGGMASTTLIYYGAYGGPRESTTPDLTISLNGGSFDLGDITGDGVDDFMVGNNVFFGNTTAVNTTADVILVNLNMGMTFGTSFVNCGDLNTDGIDDIMAGDGGDGAGYYGAAYVYYGGPGMDGNMDFLFENPTATKQQGFGDCVANLGDINNDNYHDLAISAKWFGPTMEGIVYIYYGSASWDNTSDLTIDGDDDGGSWPKFGSWVTGGKDLNGDDYPDMVVGAEDDNYNHTNAGKIYVFYGGPSWDSNEDVEIFGSADFTTLGRRFDVSDDLNGDGEADLIVGMKDNTNWNTRVHVYHGGSTFDNTSDWSHMEIAQDFTYGMSFADGGALTGFGHTNLLVGSPNDMMNRIGRWFVYNFPPMTPSETSVHLGTLQLWNQSGQFTGPTTSPDFTTGLNTLLSGSTGSMAPYNHEIVTLELNVTFVTGPLDVTGIDIEYIYNATVSDFSSEINDFLVGKTGPLDVFVPINVSTASAGKIMLKDLDIQYTPNTPPVWVDVPTDVNVTVNTSYGFDVNATDSDAGDTIAYAIISTPVSTATINAGTGVIGWMPTANGTYNFNISATDGKRFIYSEFTLTVVDDQGPVIPDNEPPVVTLVTPGNNTEIDVLNPVFQWGVVDTDDEEGNITYDIYYSVTLAKITVPDATVKKATGLTDKSYTPTENLVAGTTYYWAVIPNDGTDPGLCGSGFFTFDVTTTASVNHPPVFITTPDTAAIVGVEWTYMPVATDEDNDSLSMSLLSGPTGLTFTAGKLSWTPEAADVGDHDVEIEASDGTASVSQTFRSRL